MNLHFWKVRFWQDLGYGLGSSPYLAKSLVHIVDLSNAGTVLELGAGRGKVTEYILKAKGDHTKVIAIELGHESFVELSAKYGNACELHEINAANIGDIIEKESIDVIISTLPLGSISLVGVEAILEAAKTCLRKGGVFIQYQYALQNLGQVRKHFILDKVTLEPRNFWPAFIYKAYKK